MKVIELIVLAIIERPVTHPGNERLATKYASVDADLRDHHAPTPTKTAKQTATAMTSAQCIQIILRTASAQTANDLTITRNHVKLSPPAVDEVYSNHPPLSAQGWLRSLYQICLLQRLENAILELALVETLLALSVDVDGDLA